MAAGLLGFIDILRTHHLRISPAESLDAVRAAELLGYANRERLRDGLCTTLAKTADERTTFLRCFDQYFRRELGDFSQTSDEREQQPPNAGGAPGGLSAGSGADVPEALAQAARQDPRIDQLLQSSLMQALLRNDRNLLSLNISQASERAGLQQIRIFTQKGQYSRRILAALGEEQLRAGIVALERSESPALDDLRRYRDILREQVRDFIDGQYLVHAHGRNQQLIEDMLSRTRLSNIEAAYVERAQELVRRMAKKLAARYAPRRRDHRRGQLDMRKTLSRGAAHDGLMFDLRWRRVRRERPQVFAICDVSGSVAPYAKFLLLFLYCLQEVLPRVRSFVFANRLGEVTNLFREYPVEQAIELANHTYGGATDYGAAFQDFANLALDDVRSSATVIILGDARNNHGEPRLDLLQKIYRRANRVIWLNPESRNSWKTGDSEMLRYLSACHFSAECNNLRQLERVIEQVLKNAR
ncbi:VWA domain-containing protein [Mangrovimicrobium sediminis]|uniref:VWA domain-containing protein n=1 Tax=Mangrovimicrobium sediminis TaxID=2562682 RepID=A0A4Z0M4Q7_9GAMM|nr:VWA domain-containing protein [Haliea sp. SAOS-164]TGD74285.1 VWA domain-containing protein [Haliea sp. SAOS-164]